MPYGEIITYVKKKRKRDRLCVFGSFPGVKHLDQFLVLLLLSMVLEGWLQIH